MTAGGAQQTAAVAEFARALQDLRRAAGNPSFNDLAKATGIPRSTLHDAVSGKRMPSQRVTVTLASALGADPDEWRDRWVATDRARRPETSDQASDGPSWVRRHRLAVLVAAAAVVVAGVGVPLVIIAPWKCAQVRDYVVTTDGAVLDDQGATVGQVHSGDHLHAKSVDHGRFAHRRYGDVQPGGTSGYVDESKLDFTGMICA